MPGLSPVFLLYAFAFLQQPAVPDIDTLLKSGRERYERGDFAEARRLLEDAWKQAGELPRDDQRRYDVLRQLTSTAAAVGDYDGAENYLQIAINWKEQRSGTNVQLAPDLIELALLCRARQDYERGLVILQRVLTFYLPSGGADNPATADVFSLMGVLDLDMKRYDQAIQPLEIAIRLRESELGPEHPALLPDLDRLGPALISLRAYDKAAPVFRHSLMIRERLNGRVSAELIPSLDGLAYALFGLKKWAEAETIYQRLLEVWQTSAGPDHPMVPLVLDKTAVFYREQGRDKEAEVAAERANAIRALILAKGLYEEAGQHLLQEDSEGGLRLYRQALSVLDPARKEHEELCGKIEQKLEAFKPKQRVPLSPPRRLPKR